MHSTLEQSTLTEVDRMKAAGMEQLTIEEFTRRVCALGYFQRFSFNYVNTANAHSYKARSVSILHAKSEKSFANTDSPRDRLPELQEIRRNTFVFHAGRIWEY